MPMHIFTNQVPANLDVNVFEGSPGVTLAMAWRSEQEGVVRAVRFYLGNRNYDTATVVGVIFDWEDGTLLTQQNYTITAADPIGWVTIPLANQVFIKQQRRYIVGVYYPCDTSPDGNAHYVATSSFFTNAGIDNPPLHAPRQDAILDHRNGLFNYGPAPAYPSGHFQAGCYFVDISFDYVARMPVYNNATGTYERKLIKVRENGTWHY